jgi:ABC-2 type transport system ATP-binding protein
VTAASAATAEDTAPSPDRGRGPLLAASGIVKRYGIKHVLDGVDLTVHPGEVVALVGENGCGKTTLLRICAGITRPDAGRVEERGRIGYCPQEPGLLELLNADEHLALFGAAFGLRRNEAVAAGRQLLEELDFPVGDRSVSKDLSGGTRQKLNLALALLGDPEVLLLDEPYQGFDTGSYVNFWDHVTGWRVAGRATVVVTHMLSELSRVDRVVDLTPPSRRGPGSAEAAR